VIAAAIVFGNWFGLEVALLTLAGGVLTAAIWLVWSSLQGLQSNAPLTLDEALTLGAPSVEEEQKRAVLRALKDLEYEREVGKINDADYESLALHYRNEAKRLLRVVDQDLSAERERAEQLLEQRLRASSEESAPVADDADNEADTDAASTAERPSEPTPDRAG
jgi:hypothetical protein